MLRPSAKALARKEKFRKIGAAISAQGQHVWDKDYGGVYVYPWRILKSDGFDVLGLDTRPGLMRKIKEG